MTNFYVESNYSAPLDLDKQCGVIQGLNNLPCTRSLTCKSHSMGAKRAVDGRSQPYDVLLAAYQKKSIGRPNGNEHVSIIYMYFVCLANIDLILSL